MEDNNVLLDGHGDEVKTPAEANRKRKLKTPAQLQALEEYYEEYKYPTESMKSEIAQKIGLTEKQVSGWFCHRRLKDKRILKDEADGSGRVDRSSGVIQEHFSGPGQDSCGSTKPGDYNKRELREVESQLLAGQEFSAMNLKCHNRVNAASASMEIDMDETSSESSSPLHPSHLPQPEVPRMYEDSRYCMQNRAVLPSKPKVAIGSQSRRPSGYLKIKPKSEHPSITAVRRRLGNNFREDGPPLGIQFQPLPVGAFQAAPKDTTTGLRNGPDFLPRNISGRTCPVPNSVFKMHNGIYRHDDSYLEEQGPSEAIYHYRQSKPKSSVHFNTKPDHGWDSLTLDRDNSEKTYKDFHKGSKYDLEAMAIQPISIISAENLTTNPRDTSLLNSRYVNKVVDQRSKHLKNNFSNSSPTEREPQDISERRLYTREPKVEKIVRSSKIPDNRNLGKLTPDYELMDEELVAASNDPLESPNPLGMKVVVDNELKGNKVQFEYPHPDFLKGTLATKQGRGFAREISFSSSDDETVDTSSSYDE